MLSLDYPFFLFFLKKRGFGTLSGSYHRRLIFFRNSRPIWLLPIHRIHSFEFRGSPPFLRKFFFSSVYCLSSQHTFKILSLISQTIHIYVLFFFWVFFPSGCSKILFFFFLDFSRKLMNSIVPYFWIGNINSFELCSFGIRFRLIIYHIIPDPSFDGIFVTFATNYNFIPILEFVSSYHFFGRISGRIISPLPETGKIPRYNFSPFFLSWG